MELTYWDFISLRKQDFNHCHVHGDLGSPGCNTSLIATSTPGADSVMPVSHKELANFKKGTNRGASLHPIFKSEKHYDSFYTVFHANAKAHGLSCIIHPKFKPEYHDSFAHELSDDQHSFMYSVLVKMLQTECQSKLTKEFEGDAQRSHEELHPHPV